MTTAKSSRLRCALPHCPRTTGRHPDSYEWICSDHWRGVSPEAKAVHRRLERMVERFPYLAARRRRRGKLSVERSAALHLRLCRLANRAWRRCVEEAIEATAGVR